MLAAVAIPILVLILFGLILANALAPGLGVETPADPSRPSLFLIMAYIAAVALAFGLDAPLLRETGHGAGRTVLLGSDLGFATTAVGLRLRRRLSPLEWCAWCFVLAVGFTVLDAILSFAAFYLTR